MAIITFENDSNITVLEPRNEVHNRIINSRGSEKFIELTEAVALNLQEHTKDLECPLLVNPKMIKIIN